MRIAVVSSPRSGNSWIRTALAGALGWEDLAFHDYREAPAPLPPDCFFQIHWHREPKFERWLDDEGFRVMSIARHPLDVLLSAVRYAQRAPDVARWLGGDVGLPVLLDHNGATSSTFVEYCLSWGAAQLLSVTPEWWSSPDTLRLRYEDAVAAPIEMLGSIVEKLGGDPERLKESLVSVSMERMQRAPNRHGWRGKPDHWMEFIVPRTAHLIFRRHEAVFRKLGYVVPEYSLTSDEAAANWRRLG